MRHLVLGLVMALLLVSGQAAGGGAAPVAYLTNSASPNVFAVDTSSATPTSIAVGTTTYGVAVGPKGAKVYATGQNGIEGKLYVIDTATRAVTTVPVGWYPIGVAVNRDGSRVYVANAGSGTLSVVDTTTNTVVATVTGFGIPFGVAASPVRNCVYVTNAFGLDAISVVDAGTNKVVSGVPALGGRPAGIAVSPKETQLYVADRASSRLWVIDTAPTGCAVSPVAATVTVGPNPFAVAVTPDGKRVYVSNSGSNTVSVIDAAAVSSGASSPITVGDQPQGVSVSSDGTTVYVANFTSGTLTAITVATNATRSISPSGLLFPIAFGSFVASPQVITVNIDIMPGSDTNPINRKSKGTVSVAILGSTAYDVTMIDSASVQFAGAPVAKKPNGDLMASFEDVNGDGLVDLVLHFDTQSLKIADTDTTATLIGQMVDGTRIEGTDTITVIH